MKTPKHILRKSTKKRFGYDPTILSKGSMKPVRAKCVSCKVVRTKPFRYAVKQLRCLRCSNKITATTSAGLRSERMKDYYKKGGVHPMSGRKQSTKAKEALQKWRDKAKGRNHPSYGFRKPGHIQYERKDGTIIMVRSLYELAYAEYLDSKGYEWEYEPECFPIEYKMKDQKKEGTYLPDFYIEDLDTYIEVKGWWRWDAKPKYEAFKKQYPEVRIILVTEKTLKRKGLAYLPRDR